jgi:hypothetical protein
MASLKTERKVKAKKTHGNNPATFLYLSHTFPRTCWTKCSKPPYLVAKPLVSCNNLPLNPTNHNISYLYMGIISIYIERGNIHINWYIYNNYYYCYDYYYYIYIIFIYYVYYICPHASPSVVSSHSEALLVRGAEVKAPHEDTAAAGLPRSDGSTRRSGLTAAFLDENSCLIVINIEILYWIIL